VTDNKSRLVEGGGDGRGVNGEKRLCVEVKGC
jgi:hypothetical protein